MKRILISAANPQSFRNITLICAEINKDFEIVFADFRNVYAQNFPLPKSIDRNIDFSLKGKKKPFYLMGIFERVVTLVLLRRKFKKVSKEFDLFLLGDFGVIEYYLLKELKPIQAIFIQDAILLLPESLSFFKRLRSILYGFRPRYRLLDRIFCSGEITKETMCIDGAPKECIEPNGIPRFQEDSIFLRREHKDSVLKILLIGEAYSWHRQRELDKRQRRFLKRLDSNENDNLNFIFRKHPRDFDEYIFKSVKMDDPKETTLGSSIANCDLVVSYLMPSTVIFELMMSHIPIIFIADNNINYSKMTGWDSFTKLFTILSEEEFFETDLSVILHDFEYDQELAEKFVKRSFNPKTINAFLS